MNAVVFREPNDPVQFGYDWAFAPVNPVDPEYRQAWAEQQRRWLFDWMPRPESVH